VSWLDHLRADPLPWLVSEESPAVRAAALQRLLGMAPDFAELGHDRDQRLARALAFVEASQDAQGRWANRYAYNGKTWVDIGHQGEPSKWVTLRACAVLRAAHG
jgi:hypothetical protein